MTAELEKLSGKIHTLVNKLLIIYSELDVNTSKIQEKLAHEVFSIDGFMNVNETYKKEILDEIKNSENQNEMALSIINNINELNKSYNFYLFLKNDITIHTPYLYIKIINDTLNELITLFDTAYLTKKAKDTVVNFINKSNINRKISQLDEALKKFVIDFSSIITRSIHAHFGYFIDEEQMFYFTPPLIAHFKSNKKSAISITDADKKPDSDASMINSDHMNNSKSSDHESFEKKTGKIESEEKEFKEIKRKNTFFKSTQPLKRQKRIPENAMSIEIQKRIYEFNNSKNKLTETDKNYFLINHHKIIELIKIEKLTTTIKIDDQKLDNGVIKYTLSNYKSTDIFNFFVSFYEKLCLLYDRKNYSIPRSGNVIKFRFIQSEKNKINQNIVIYNEYTQLATSIINHTQSTIKDGSTKIETNLLDDKEKNHIQSSIDKMRKEVHDSINIFNIDNDLFKLITSIKLSSQYSLGNCSELSREGFIHSFQVNPQIRCEIFKIFRGDHYFIVIGRPLDSDIKKPESWGNAIICDPLIKKTYEAKYYVKYLKIYHRTNIGTGFINNFLNYNQDFNKIIPEPNMNSEKLLLWTSNQEKLKLIKTYNEKIDYLHECLNDLYFEYNDFIKNNENLLIEIKEKNNLILEEIEHIKLNKIKFFSPKDCFFNQYHFCYGNLEKIVNRLNEFLSGLDFCYEKTKFSNFFSNEDEKKTLFFINANNLNKLTKRKINQLLKPNVALMNMSIMNL